MVFWILFHSFCYHGTRYLQVFAMHNWLFWDPNPTPFVIPFINRPIAWYGILFALGFFIGFYLLKSLFKTYLKTVTDWGGDKIEIQSKLFSERLTVYVLIANVEGARLGHILFYEKWGDYFYHPLEILKTWEGGLASHGGVIGILIGIVIFHIRNRKEFPFLSVVRIIDLLVIPALLVGTFIRLGNFVNQEVLGTVTNAPWAVVFGHPIDGSISAPRHPAQLYEAIFYFMSFVGFYGFFRTLLLPRARLAGLFFIATFGFRFLVEYVKEEQSMIFGSSFLTMGQVLSIPMVFFGLFLALSKHFRKEQEGLADPKAC